MTRCVVIGAGVAGLTTATALVERGFDVQIIDRSIGPGPDQCSWWAGGMLAPWCERESAEQDVVDLGRDAVDWWDCRTNAVSRLGTLVVATGRDAGELRRFSRRTTNYERVNAAEIAALEPDLADRFNQGLFFAEEAHLDPRVATAVLSTRLRAQGVSIEYGTDQVPNADCVLDCRGLSARDMLPDLRGVKGEMLVLHSRDLTFSRPVRLLHPRHPLYIVPRGQGMFMLGATMLESEDRKRVTARSMLELLGAAYALHPAFAEAEIVEIGVDARPAFRDNLPMVLNGDDRIFVNGFYRHGFLLAPAMAERAARMVAAHNARVA